MWRWPFDRYAVTCEFGRKGTTWKCGYHSGIDLVSMAIGGDGIVYPICSGVVQIVSTSASYGNYIIINHFDNIVALYAHLKSTFVKAGDVASTTKAIGIEGATGNVSGKHLHLEIHYGAYSYPSAINPETFLDDKIKGGNTVASTYTKLPVFYTVRIPAADFKVINWKKGKRTTTIKNYACFPFQASGTVPVGNIIADGVKLATDSRLSTIWVTAGGKVGVGKTPPVDAKNAVSGIPLILGGNSISMAAAMAEGWDTTPLYATTHAMIGVTGDDLYYYVFTSTKTGVAASWAEIQAYAQMLGHANVLLGDGGGSTILDINGKNAIESFGNRTLASMIRF